MTLIAESRAPSALALALAVRPWLAPATLAAALAAVYLLVDPRTSDLPAHLFRVELFAGEGFTIWSNQWYGGHHTPAYSVLFPPLAWLLSPMLVGAVSAVAATVLFERLARGHFGQHARWGALWLAAGMASQLFTDRLPFCLGAAIGLGAVLALARRKRAAAAALALASALASPVAGAFVALAAVAFALAEVRTGEPVMSRVRGDGLVVAASGLVPPAALAVTFPEGGYHPFAFSSFVAVPLFAAAAFALLPARERVLRLGVALYVLAATAAFLVHTPLGGNVTRLGALFGGPVLACALSGRRWSGRRVAAGAAVLLALAYWQWAPAARAYLDARDDPAVEAAYYDPLLDFLEREPPAGRVEIPFTRSHFETAAVAPRFALARGWQRQLDVGRNPLFYDGELTDSVYAHWLRDNAVTYVALADAPSDYSAREERRLVEARPPYLTPVWRSEHWEVFRVRGAEPLVSARGGAEMRLAGFDRTGFTLDVQTPGSALVRVRWTPYWRARGACLEPVGQWTRVDARRAGPLRVSPSFSLDRVLQRGRRCE